jgi:hypothetical protein
MDMKKKNTKEPFESEESKSNLEGFDDHPTFVTEVVEEVPEEEVSEPHQQNGQEVTKSAVEETPYEEEIEEETEEEVEEKPTLTDFHEVDVSNEPQAVNEEAYKKQKVEDIYSSKHSTGLVDIALNKNSKSTGQPIVVWAFIIIAVALATGGGLLMFVKNSSGSTAVEVKPTPTVAQSVSSTPVPVAIKREELNVQVLNGGGKSGAGSEMKAFLTDLGYTVSDVGNTKEYTFDKTEIEVKAGKEGALELLRNDLAKDYSLGTVAATLASDSLYDARVTVGK